MNTKHLDEWIAALRSGEFAQGHGQLKDAEDGYCCLGVGCEISGLKYEPSWGTPTEEFWEWLGVETGSDAVSNTEDRLINFNDVDRWDFDQIATWLDENRSAWEDQP